VKLPAALSSAPKSMPGFVKKELPMENAREVMATTLSSTTSSTTPSASTYSYPSGTLTDKAMPTSPVSEFLDAMDKEITSGATMEKTKTKALYKVSGLQQWRQLRPSSFTKLTGTNFGSYASSESPFAGRFAEQKGPSVFGRNSIQQKKDGGGESTGKRLIETDEGLAAKRARLEGPNPLPEYKGTDYTVGDYVLLNPWGISKGTKMLAMTTITRKDTPANMVWITLLSDNGTTGCPFMVPVANLVKIKHKPGDKIPVKIGWKNFETTAYVRSAKMQGGRVCYDLALSGSTFIVLEEQLS
jgi:hypothetical protein